MVYEDNNVSEREKRIYSLPLPSDVSTPNGVHGVGVAGRIGIEKSIRVGQHVPDHDNTPDFVLPFDSENPQFDPQCLQGKTPDEKSAILQAAKECLFQIEDPQQREQYFLSFMDALREPSEERKVPPHILTPMESFIIGGSWLHNGKPINKEGISLMIAAAKKRKGYDANHSMLFMPAGVNQVLIGKSDDEIAQTITSIEKERDEYRKKMVAGEIRAFDSPGQTALRNDGYAVCMELSEPKRDEQGRFTGYDIGKWKLGLVIKGTDTLVPWTRDTLDKLRLRDGFDDFFALNKDALISGETSELYIEAKLCKRPQVVKRVA